MQVSIQTRHQFLGAHHLQSGWDGSNESKRVVMTAPTGNIEIEISLKSVLKFPRSISVIAEKNRSLKVQWAEK